VPAGLGEHVTVNGKGILIMPAVSLPEDGELRLGSVSLSGRRVRAYKGSDEPVAWITDEPVPDAGRVWRMLGEMATETGLQPVLHVAPRRSTEDWRPEDDFGRPEDVDQIGRLNAEDVLMREWAGRAVDEEVPEGLAARFDPAELYAPFSRQFPGLAPRTEGGLTAAGTLGALDTLPAARVCLIAVSRPADIPTAVGWEVTDAWKSMLPVSAVLRSWEDRFGARLVLIGPGAEIRLIVERPARTSAAAQAVTAELWAFADAWMDYRDRKYSQLNEVPDIVPRVLYAASWGLWWD
jgi:hypothetical protein